MRTITRLTAKGRSAARTVVELDGEEWATIDTEVVLARQFARGDVLDEAACEAVLSDDAFVRARRAAARLLQTRPRARVELRRRLAERGFDEPILERVAAHFEEKGDLDDARFARIFAAHQFKTKRVGPLKVRAQLRELGVGEADAVGALERQPGASREEQERRARRLIERRLERPGAKDTPATLRRRISGALLRAGFESDVFGPLLEEMLSRR